MNTKKHHPNDKLQKSSIIFLQLGLILAMLFVYSILETKVEKSKFTTVVPEVDSEELFIFPEAPPKFKIKRPKEKPVEIIKPAEPKKPSNEFKLDPNDSPKKETPQQPTESINEDDLSSAINELPDFTEDTEDEPILFVVLEKAPVFPGCEGLNKEEAKICFTKQIKKFVNRKFNSGIAEELGLQGKQRIHVQFVIDKNGHVTDIKTRAPHKQLEKEAKRVMSKLPKMTPGMQRKRPVPVKYTLPILFEVY